jgi:hypothetical protein
VRKILSVTDVYARTDLDVSISGSKSVLKKRRNDDAKHLPVEVFHQTLDASDEALSTQSQTCLDG